MTILTVASSLFTLPQGKYILPNPINLSSVTILQLKALLQDEFGEDVCPMSHTRIFWHGYLLGDRSASTCLFDECKGSSGTERVRADEAHVTVFLTANVSVSDSESEDEGEFSAAHRERNNSFEARLKGRRETCAMS